MNDLIDTCDSHRDLIFVDYREMHDDTAQHVDNQRFETTSIIDYHSVD